MDFFVIIFLFFGVVILASIMNAAMNQPKAGEGGGGLRCPPHAWRWTEPGPGRIEILRCQTCGFIAGPVDEHGRPNPNFNPPRGG